MRAIGNVVDMNGLSDSMRDNILRAYLGEPDPTQYGIVQAVTAEPEAPKRGAKTSAISAATATLGLWGI